MICCVLHARVHPAERHQPTPTPPPNCLRATAQRDWHHSIQYKFCAHTTERTGSIVYIHAVARAGRGSPNNNATGNLHFFMIKTQATPNIQHFIYSILLTDNHNKIIFSVIKYIVHFLKEYQTMTSLYHFASPLAAITEQHRCIPTLRQEKFPKRTRL